MTAQGSMGGYVGWSPTHYQQAVEMMDFADGLGTDPHEAILKACSLLQAQVHATLALAEAVAGNASSRSAGDVS